MAAIGQVVCSIQIETLNSRNETIRCEKYRNGNISLWRNEFREIVLAASQKSSLHKFVLHDVKIHSKFMKEGKSTIVLTNHGVRLLLSNCPPADLKGFFQILSVKLVNFKKMDSLPQGKKLLAGLPSSFEEISPLNQKDLVAINHHSQDSSKPSSSKNPVGGTKKRKPFCDVTNHCHSGEPLAKKRVLTLPSDNLSKEQQHVLKIVKQRKNIFFTGSAGTGKSFLLRHVVGLLPPAHTFVTASTGVAACHIGGMTLHSFAGIKNAGPVDQVIRMVSSRKGIVKQWRTCKHLIIDEISMIDGDFFDCIEALARTFCNSDKPFGGIQLIICGDFFQLPPVSKAKQKKKYCFQAKSWSQCIEYSWELQKVYRQTESDFIQLLQEIRLGKCVGTTNATLKATQYHKSAQNGILSTKLCTHVENVKQINQTELDKLPGQAKMFLSVDNSEAYTTVLDKLLPDTYILHLKVGTQVMLTKNISVQQGLVNGARGIVVSFTNSQKPLPVVRFLSGLSRTISVESFSVKISNEVLAIRKQLPLKLAWAISIHKSQGMSLDCVEMSLSRVFESGQAYVALSRAKSLKGLRVLDFNSSCVHSNVDVLRFYRQLRAQQHSLMELLPFRP